jgi:DNA polymerase/3'-5' exonuclease PolX
MGEKKVENIRKGIEIYEHAQERIPISEATNIAEAVIDHLKKNPDISRISPAGSLRQMKETVGDIDILATGKNRESIIEYFTKFPGVIRTLATGKTKGSVLIEAEGREYQVDLRIVNESEYGAALQYFTGSKAHNIKLRSLANKQGLKISEYGVFKGEEKIAGANEEEVYQTLELNAYYDRLVLNEFYLKKAKERGIKISLDTDTHHGDGLRMMQFGVGIARRAWPEKKDILNCLSYNKLKKFSKGILGTCKRRI